MVNETLHPLAHAARVVVAALAAATLAGCISFAQTAGDTGRPDNLDALREHALELVNEDRAEHGLPPVRRDDVLDRIAQSHASDQLARDYYGHVSPEGKDVQDRYLAAGGEKWRLIEENVATCTGCQPTLEEVTDLQRGWMNSPGHRENILRRGIDRFGFGIAGEDGRVYAVQTFSGPGSSGEGAEEAASPSELQSAALEAVNEARREAGVEPLEMSEALSAGARAMMPASGSSSFEPGSMNDFVAALPEETRARFSAYSTSIGICGGCGTKPTAADARDFVQQWLENPRQRQTVLAERFTEMGFAVAADGQGKKIGIATFAEPR